MITKAIATKEFVYALDKWTFDVINPEIKALLINIRQLVANNPKANSNEPVDAAFLKSIFDNPVIHNKVTQVVDLVNDTPCRNKTPLYAVMLALSSKGLSYYAILNIPPPKHLVNVKVISTVYFNTLHEQ